MCWCGVMGDGRWEGGGRGNVNWGVGEREGRGEGGGIEAMSLVPSFQDLDGNYRVETVRTVVANDRDCLSSEGSETSLAGKECEKVTFLLEEDHTVRYFEHRHLRYLYRPSEGRFVLLRGLDASHTPSALHEMKGGLLLDEHATRYGSLGGMEWCILLPVPVPLTLPPSLPPSHPPSLPPSLPLSLPLTLPPSLLPPSLPPSSLSFLQSCSLWCQLHRCPGEAIPRSPGGGGASSILHLPAAGRGLLDGRRVLLLLL